jgi:hypothetical protein
VAQTPSAVAVQQRRADISRGRTAHVHVQLEVLLHVVALVTRQVVPLNRVLVSQVRVYVVMRVVSS